MRIRILFPLLIVLIAGDPVFPQREAPCSTPEFRQFDFWVGEWEVSWPTSASTEGKAGSGTNRIHIALDKCVIVENFDGTPKIPLRGMSVSVYNVRKKKWQQTWVDYLELRVSSRTARWSWCARPSPPMARKFSSAWYGGIFSRIPSTGVGSARTTTELHGVCCGRSTMKERKCVGEANAVWQHQISPLPSSPTILSKPLNRRSSSFNHRSW